VSICPWDSIPEKEPKVAECILEMVSSYLRNHTMPPANVGDDLPRKVCGAKPHAEHTWANDQGEA